MSTPGFAMTLHQAARAIGARASGEDVAINGVSTDTRTLRPGQLFVALHGPHFDGHDYIAQAIEKGAVACLVDRQVDVMVPLMMVEDTRLALGKLAKVWRQKLAVPLVAVTGSNGKTTVKEMLAAIFACETPVLATRGNLNNDIGLPLTLLQLHAGHQRAVVEMGANHPGEIAYLTEIAVPDVGVITNAGAAHLEGFGSLEGVARAKGELFAGLPADGVAVINADDPFASLWREIAAARRVVTFGLKEGADVSADWQAGENGSQMKVRTPQGEFDIQLPLLGEHNVLNALAAIAAAQAAGATCQAIRDGLNTMQAVPGRLQLKRGLRGSRIIDDTYNANPTSLTAALKVLRDFPGEHLLALGDMGELGAEAEALHTAAGRQAREGGVDRLYTIGRMAAAAARAFGEAAMPFDVQDAAIDAIQKDLNNDTTLLVKGSRLSHMERVVNALVNGQEV